MCKFWCMHMCVCVHNHCPKFLRDHFGSIVLDGTYFTYQQTSSVPLSSSGGQTGLFLPLSSLVWSLKNKIMVLGRKLAVTFTNKAVSLYGLKILASKSPIAQTYAPIFFLQLYTGQWFTHNSPYKYLLDWCTWWNLPSAILIITTIRTWIPNCSSH